MKKVLLKILAITISGIISPLAHSQLKANSTVTHFTNLILERKPTLFVELDLIANENSLSIEVECERLSREIFEQYGIAQRPKLGKDWDIQAWFKRSCVNDVFNHQIRKGDGGRSMIHVPPTSQAIVKRKFENILLDAETAKYKFGERSPNIGLIDTEASAFGFEPIATANGILHLYLWEPKYYFAGRALNYGAVTAQRVDVNSKNEYGAYTGYKCYYALTHARGDFTIRTCVDTFNILAPDTH